MVSTFIDPNSINPEASRYKPFQDLFIHYLAEASGLEMFDLLLVGSTKLHESSHITLLFLIN